MRVPQLEELTQLRHPVIIACVCTAYLLPLAIERKAMNKSTIWQSIVSVLVIILAVLIVLNIQHPTWVKSLLFWQPKDQREIAWLYGVDLGNTYRISLIAEGEEKPSVAQMQAGLDTIKSRAKNLSLTDPAVQLLGDDTIVVQVPNSQDLSIITPTLQAPGLIEFVNVGSEVPTSEIVETTLDGPSDAEAAPTETITPTAEAPTIYETLMTNNDLEYIELRPPSYGYYGAKFRFRPSGDKALLDHNQSHPGEYICITLDKHILTCALSSQLMETDLGGNVEYPIIIEEKNAQATSALFRSGVLPVQLQVDKVEPASPALGEKAIQRLGTAAIIALAAALAFLLAHYRLPGVLAVLPLLVFALLSLALCRILPLPITLATIIGLAATGLTTLGALLSITERLRNRTRAGQALPKAVEVSLSNAWASIRNTHLALGLLAIATWLVGAIVAAQTIHWLGVSLVTGTLASLFATMVFGHPLIRLIFGIEAIQALLNERKWLLGI
jgi:protein-export membrane protein SecD